MKDDPIPDDDHVSRYCRSVCVHEGWPMVAAFELRPGIDNYVSVNWLEYWNSLDLVAALDCVRAEVTFPIEEEGRFVVLSVREIKEAVQRIPGFMATVTHQPSRIKSHAGIFGFTENECGVPAELWALVTHDNLLPAIVPDD